MWENQELPLIFANLSEDELNNNEDAIMEAIASVLGISEDHVIPSEAIVNSDGSLLSIVPEIPPSIEIPVGFHAQVEAAIQNILGLEDVSNCVILQYNSL